MTARISRVWSALTVCSPTAETVPVPRTLAVMEPLVTYWVATSGRLRFIQVLEKKVSTSSTERKIMAAFLTQSRFFVLFSMGLLSFHTSRIGDALNQVLLPVEENQQGRDHIHSGHGEGQADLPGVDL